MLKRCFLIMTLLGTIVPMAAIAGNISTRVMTVGGSATMGSGAAQTSATGTVTKFFGTVKYYNSSGVLMPQVDTGTTVAFLADTGYAISAAKLNGVAVALTSPVTVPASSAAQSVTIEFAHQTVAVTANPAAGGSVIPGGTKSVFVGTPLTYVFTPSAGAKVQSIAGLPSGATLTDPKNALATVAFPYAGPVAVTFTPVAGTNITMTPSFLAITASAGSAQSVATGTAVTLAGTSSDAAATFAWTQVGGPALGTPWTASIAAPTVILAAAGNYTFQVIATSAAGVSAPSAVVVTAVANYTPLSVSQTARVQCENCHSAQGVGAGIFAQYSSSIHGEAAHSLCSACHYGTLTGSHPGSVDAASVNKTTFLVLQNGVVGGNGTVVNTGDLFCTTCHSGAYPIPHPVTGLATSCQFCHTTAGTGDAHQIQPAGSVTLGACTPCHTNGVTPAALTQSGANCDVCHNTLQAHLFTSTSAIVGGADNCLGCHDKSIHASFANNSGARIIVGANGEFGGATARQNAKGYRSHHIYNGAAADPDNAQCIACHLEGTVGADLHTVKIDNNYHMKDGLIHLRSGNTDIAPNDIKWNPASPNHAAMDNFCMSCHNAAGAKSVYSNISGALLAGANVKANMALSAANRPSAKNPFGDLLTNAYDGLVRTAVVAVYEQFDTGNTSHHAVRGQKYTTRSKAGSTYVDANGTTGAALFTQYSGASVGSIRISPTTGLPTIVREVFGNYTATYGASGMGAKTPGSRHTIYESTLFTSAFQALDGTTLGDDSTIHCGDCHTVGQWKSASAKNADGSVTVATIGAHGSKNEYMLRTSNGSDALMAANTATQVALTYGSNNQATNVATNGTLVCYLCHKQEAYTGNVGYFRYTDPLTGATSARLHIGVASGDCLNSSLNSTGQTTFLTRVGGLGKNQTVFGILCLNCHGGNTQIFGGIHGNATSYGDTKNVGYKTYSTNGKDAVTAAAAGLKPSSGGIASPAGTGNSENRNAQLTIVTRKPYRFAGGNSLKYNGGGTASKWEAKAMTTIHREGCYNLQTSTTGSANWSGADGSQLIVPDYYNATTGGATVLPAVANGVADDLSSAQNNGTSSSTGTYGWGSCTHHSGTNTGGSNNASTRQIQRPLNY